MSKKIDKIREAVANYIATEGCNCCESPDHDHKQDELAKLLAVERYDDDSGNDFSKYQSK